MQLSDSLEVAIGLSFVFLLLSLIMTALQEAVESFLKVRGSHLFDGFVELLSDPDHPAGGKLAEAQDFLGGVLAWARKQWGKLWGYPTPAPAPVHKAVQALYEHPLIHGLYRGDFASAMKHNALPSYIPARNFSLALIDQIVAARVDAAEADVATSLPPAGTAAERLRLASERIQSEPLRRAVLQAVDMAGGDMDRVQKNLEAWYDSGMDRVSGWYRRRTQMFLFFFGLTAAVVLNINALMIADSLAQNATLRRAVAASVETNLSKYDQDKRPAVAAEREPADAAPAAASATPAAPLSEAQKKAQEDAKAAADKKASDDDKAAAVSERRLTSEAIGDIQNLGLPIGWGAAGRNAYTQAFDALDIHMAAAKQKAAAKADPAEPPRKPMIPVNWPHLGLLMTIGLGWLMTALAVTLGAPFWFDVLNRLVVIRATVKPHEKSREERSQDPQDKKGGTVNLQVTPGPANPGAAGQPPMQGDDGDPVVDDISPADRPREGDEHETHLAAA